MATLLHDIGKPRTLLREPDGRAKFIGHAPVGAAMAADRLRHWRLPESFIGRVRLLIDQHLRPAQVAPLGVSPSGRALFRFHRDLGEGTASVCLMFLADSLATAPDKVLAEWHAYVQHAMTIVQWSPPETSDAIGRLVDGNTIMRELRLSPGPLVGRILRRIEEAAASGEVTSVDDAIRHAGHIVADLRDEESRSNG